MSTTGITFSGVGSGLPVQSWIDAMIKVERIPVDALYTKKSTYSQSITTLNSLNAQFSSLRTSTEKLTDGNLSAAFDLFKSKKATTSDAAIATVTAGNSALIQNMTLEVKNLATSTISKSIANISQFIDGSEKFTDLSNHLGKTGVFNIYVNGVKNEIEIEDADTLNSIATKINTKFASGNVVASVTDNKFNITYDNTTISNLTLGSNADTSNFFNMMKLSTATAVNNGDGTSSFSSLTQINKINLGGKIVGNEANLNVSAPITAGTFKIGQTEFTIDANMTFGGIIARINSDDKSGVNASYDAATNKLVLTSKTPGKTYINIENGTSNFLTQAGLIDGAGNSMVSQTLGNNAKVYINSKSTDIPAPTPLEVNSNSITSDISGIAGVTINLKNLSSSNTPAGTSIDINVEQDSDQLYNAVNDFINKFNTVISSIDSNTAIGKDLHNEYTLVNIRNSMRLMIADKVTGLSTYQNLANIGITSGAIGKSAKDTSTTISIDKSKFVEAMEKNPSEVRALLIGDSQTGIKGILQKMEEKLESVLEPTKGFFAAKKESINQSIADTDKSIKRGEERITQYKNSITQQFAQMDQYISKMQQQGSALSSIG